MSGAKSQVIIGAGEQRWDGWIPTEQVELDLLQAETFKKFFGNECADAFLCEHTWEHLTIEEGVRAAETCWRFLKPGGRLRVAVPDGRFPDAEYQRTVQVGGPGPADHPAAGHQVVYVAEVLVAVFEGAGFSVTLLEWWDTSGTFHTTRWRIEDGPIYRSCLMDHRNESYRKRLRTTRYIKSHSRRRASRIALRFRLPHRTINGGGTFSTCKNDSQTRSVTSGR